MIRITFAVAAAIVSTGLAAAPTPRGQPIRLVCTGPVVEQGRNLAKSEKLVLGQQPGACFGRMQIYDGPNRQWVVSAPSTACPGGKAIDVYDQSRAGSWFRYFEKPVCGSSVSIGPKSPWGDWMLTIDGRHYVERGAYYVQLP